MRQFVADAGHELRTPLTIVLGYIDLLRRKADAGDERSRADLHVDLAEGARMRTLIDNLVLLARMEGDDVRPAEPFELRPLLEEIVDARRVLAPALRIELDCAVDATVIGDRDEIHEAIANVVDNAIKYAPGSPIRVAARGRRRRRRGDDRRRRARASIPTTARRSSTASTAARRAATSRAPGSGLAIAKRAVERAGGTLRAGASVADGTTFALAAARRRRTPREPRRRRLSGLTQQPLVARSGAAVFGHKLAHE